MTDAESALAWTCPFCALLCEDFALAAAAARPGLIGSDCARARAALAAHAGATGEPVTAWVDGRRAPIDEALDAAAAALDRWRQPLFAGLGTDIAGARALYRLAARTGAICDTATPGLWPGLRALQDRGQFTTTLGEVRSRADLVVLLGTPGNARHPEFFRRIGLQAPDSPCRTLVFVGVKAPAGVAGSSARPEGAQTVEVRGTGDPYADLQQLGALVAGARLREPDAGLADLARRLAGARYTALVWEPQALPPHGALWAESLQRLAFALNARTRAGTLALGGDDGTASVNQAFTWLSGLPLRTRVGANGLEHDPVRFDSQRLLADRSVDGLLWVSSFDPARLPPPAAQGLPRIVLGPPAMAARLAGAAGIFLPVATPGLNAPGHLCRTDGIVIVPLAAVRDEGLPGVAEVAARLAARLETGA